LNAASVTASTTVTAADGCIAAAASGVVAVGHRGAAGVAPENTLASFRAAMAQGARWVETDVQLTSDGVPVLLHDLTLDRTTNAAALFPTRRPWSLNTFILAEVRQLDAGSGRGAAFAGERVPTLAELLGALKQAHTGLMLEIKSGESDATAKIASALESADWVASGMPMEPLCVSSFAASRVQALKALQPSVEGQVIFNSAPTVTQITTVAAISSGLLVPYASLGDPVYHFVPNGFGVYGVNTPAQLSDALSKGAKIVVTDDIPAIRSALGSAEAP
jgi:glycerophosphoryl diester phosphodiesterase